MTSQAGISNSTLLFRTSQLGNFHNQENPMDIDNNSEDRFCCTNTNSTDDPRQFGELFTHGRVGGGWSYKESSRRHSSWPISFRNKRTSSIERSTLLWHRDERSAHQDESPLDRVKSPIEDFRSQHTYLSYSRHMEISKTRHERSPRPILWSFSDANTLRYDESPWH